MVPAPVSAPIVIATNLLNASVFASLSAGALPSDLRRYPAFLFINILGLGSDLYLLFFLSLILVNGFRFFRDTALESKPYSTPELIELGELAKLTSYSVSVREQ